MAAEKHAKMWSFSWRQVSTLLSQSVLAQNLFVYKISFKNPGANELSRFVKKINSLSPSDAIWRQNLDQYWLG